MNKVILMGRLTADPETRYTPSNISIARFTLAVNRGGKPQEGQPTADFLNIVTWRNTADFVGKYFKKGMQVLVEGRIHNNNYTDKEGQKRYNVEVTADQVYFADSRKDGNNGDNSGGGYNSNYSNNGGNSGGAGSGYSGGNSNNSGNYGGNQGNSGNQSNSGGFAANNTSTPEAGDGFYTLNEDDEDLPF